MDALLPLKRTRIELDDMVRTRAFFARVIRGGLRDAEYSDLLSQLAALVHAASGPLGDELAELARRDALALTQGAWSQSPPCDAVVLLESIRGAAGRFADERTLSDVYLATIATSWTRDATETLGRCRPEATRLVSAMAWRGPRCLDRLEAAVVADPRSARIICILGEFVRGAFLATAMHLDATWPPPRGALLTA